MSKKHIMKFAASCILAAIATGCMPSELWRNSGNGREMRFATVSSLPASTTKCSDEAGGEVLFSEPIRTDSGDTLFLTAYVSEMPDDLLPCGGEGTKAAPIDNDNIKTIYGSFTTTVYGPDGNLYESVIDPLEETPETQQMKNVSVGWDSSTSQWLFGGGPYYWPTDDTKLTFCSYAPEGAIESPVWDYENGTFTFGYTAPKDVENKDDAAQQKDLLVAVTQQTKNSYGGTVKVHFQHALTAVRFIKGNIDNVTLEYISINNIHNKGTATLTHTDSGDQITWSNLDGNESYRQVFNTEVTSLGHHESFDRSASKEHTFMVIPQELGEDSEIAIYIQGNLHPETLKLKTFVEDKGIKDDQNNPVYNWAPYQGKMITFAISAQKINNVSVSITDEVVTGDLGYPKKQNITITNTGRSDIYIRATIVGSWQNAAGQNLLPWSETDSYGVFSGGLLDSSSPSDAYWVKGSDGFYYYKYYLPKAKDNVKHVALHPLFESFQLTGAPDSISTEGTEGTEQDLSISQLNLTILVQAVIADQNSSKASAKAAWGDHVAGYLSTEADH